MAVRRPHNTSSNAATATFDDLGVPAPLTAVLAARGITIPTPIQAATLPDSLAGRDVLGRGRTGSGKTYAFLLPVLTRLLSLPVLSSVGWKIVLDSASFESQNLAFTIQQEFRREK